MSEEQLRQARALKPGEPGFAELVLILCGNENLVHFEPGYSFNDAYLCKAEKLASPRPPKP